MEKELSKGEKRILVYLFDKKEIPIENGKTRRIVNSLTKKDLVEIKRIFNKEKNEFQDIATLTERGEKVATILKLQKEIAKAYEIANNLLYAYEIDKKKEDEIIKTINTLSELAQRVEEESEKKKALRIIYIISRRSLKKMRIK